MFGIACLQAGLVPGSYVGMGNIGTGCFNTGTGVTLGMLASCLSTRACCVYMLLSMFAR